MISVCFPVAFALLCGMVYLLKSSRVSNNKEDATTAKIGILGSVRYILLSFLNPQIPNYEAAETLHKRHGLKTIMIQQPLSKLVMGSTMDLALAKKIMSSSNWINHFRDDYYIYYPTLNKPMGILFGNGEYWRQGRSLTLKLMHQTDCTRPEKLQSVAYGEMNELQKRLEAEIEQNGGQVTIAPTDWLQEYTMKIVFQIIAGFPMDPKDPRVEKFLSEAHTMNREFNVGNSVLEVFPWLRSVPKLTFFDSFQAANDSIVYLCKDIVAERKKLGLYKENPSDFLDYFLLEVDKRAGKDAEFINYDSLLIILRDMVWAGGETPSVALEHGILQVSLNPKIQTRVQAEIDRVLGRRMPNYNDRTSMPYTQAVLLEILRYSCPVPFTSRSPLTDTKIGNDDVPKGSLIGVNLYALSRSEELWGDPHVFRPERFLSPEGEIINTEKLIAFGYGKRQCIGEASSRITMFIFFVTLLQNYSFEPSRNHPPPSLKNLPGISRTPMKYFVNVRNRKLEEGMSDSLQRVG